MRIIDFVVYELKIVLLYVCRYFENYYGCDVEGLGCFKVILLVFGIICILVGIGVM